jgi:uncharacterized protein (TIGR00255 family)
MALASMTGFARATGQHEGLAWTWEVKSVNGRALDLRFRLPPGFDGLEAVARQTIGARLKRGSVTCALQIAETQSRVSYRLNEALLEQVNGIIGRVAEKIETAAPRLDGILGLRGVIEVVEPELDEATREAREQALTEGLKAAVERLAENRAAEGRHLAAILTGLLDEMAALADEARRVAAARPDAWRARLEEQVAAVLDKAPAVSEERLTQELALIIARGDVREELDRLAAHLSAARAAIAKDDPGGVGRRLDFLAQELNREANTLCSKSGDAELTRIGLDLKLAIDRFREQAANVE